MQSERCTQSAGTEQRSGDEELSEVIRGHQRSSEVIRGHQRPSSCNQTPGTEERRVDEEPRARAQTACMGHAVLVIAREGVAEQADEE